MRYGALTRAAFAAAVARDELPAVPRAYQRIAIDVAVADATAIVRARIVDDDEPAALEPGDRDLAGAIARSDDRADGDEAHFVQLRPTVVGVVA